MSENDWGSTMAGAGLTGAVAALAYGIVKLIRRSRCASHTACCDLDIARAETERKKESDLESTILNILKKTQVAQTVAEEKNHEIEMQKLKKTQVTQAVAEGKINSV